MRPRWYPSPNHEPRAYPIGYIILHGTWMADDQAALDRLCDPLAKVSCHYFITQDAELYQLVGDERVAWHAGVSAWAHLTGLNKYSLGIEISNPGEATGTPYTEEQYRALENLLRQLMQRHNIPATHVLAHSDIAPERKDDPGIYFDWARLVEKRLAAPWQPRAGDPWQALQDAGYRGEQKAVVAAFQRRYLPSHVSGELCPTTAFFINNGSLEA